MQWYENNIPRAYMAVLLSKVVTENSFILQLRRSRKNITWIVFLEQYSPGPYFQYTDHHFIIT